MIKVIINSQKHGTVWREFDNQLQVDAYIDEVTLSQHWGRNAWTEVVVPEVKDELGNMVTPAETVDHPAEWSWSQEDISAQVLAEKKLEHRIKKQNFGARLIAEITNMNSDKGLDAAGLAALLSDTSVQMIQDLLWSGSLDFAKAQILAYPGALYTLEEKQALAAKIDAWISANPEPS